YFKRMDEAFETAQTLADSLSEVPDEVKRIPSVRNSFWRLAHNKSVQLINNDSVRTSYENPNQRALAYITNAIIIQPTHGISYRVKAILSGRMKQYSQAAEAQKNFISRSDSITARNYLVLVQYYRQAEQLEDAKNVLMK